MMNKLETLKNIKNTIENLIENEKKYKQCWLNNNIVIYKNILKRVKSLKDLRLIPAKKYLKKKINNIKEVIFNELLELLSYVNNKIHKMEKTNKLCLK